MLQVLFKKKKLLVISGVIIALIISYIIYVNHKGISLAPTVTVVKGSVTEDAEAIGYIKPRHSSTVKSQIDGTVDEIYHYEGDYVTVGTPLLSVKPAPQPADYATAYEQVVEATSDLRSADIDLKRYKQSLKQKIITANFTDYIAAQKNYNTAQERLLLAKQKLALLEKGRINVNGKPIANVVVSPTNGYILSRNVDVGDPVISLSSAQASTALFSIADMKDLMFKGVVDEMDTAKIKVSMPAEIKVGSLPDAKVTGVVSKIALQSEKESTNQGFSNTENGLNSSTSPFNVGFAVEITDLKLPKDLVLRSGYSATAKVKINSVSNVLILPMRVVQFEDEKPYVLVQQDKNHEPRHHPVKLGISDGINVEIQSGLNLGDKVVDKVETKP